MSTKVITQEELGECSPWALPDVAGLHAGSGRGAGGLMTAKQLEAIQKEAYTEGFAQGRKDGQAAGLAQLQARARRMDQLMATFDAPFTELDQRIEQELVTLAMAVARQLVRRELKTDPGQVVAVVREALAALPVASQNVRLHLHPEDAALVREALSLSEGERSWRIIEDPVLSRGGCQIVTHSSQIDASVESRLAAIIAKVLGGERENDL